MSGNSQTTQSQSGHEPWLTSLRQRHGVHLALGIAALLLCAAGCSSSRKLPTEDDAVRDDSTDDTLGESTTDEPSSSDDEIDEGASRDDGPASDDASSSDDDCQPTPTSDRSDDEVTPDAAGVSHDAGTDGGAPPSVPDDASVAIVDAAIPTCVVSDSSTPPGQSFDPPARPNQNTEPFELSFEGFPLEDGIEITDVEALEAGKEFLVITRHGWLQRYRFDPADFALLDAFLLEDASGDPLFQTPHDCGGIGIALAPDYALTKHVYISGCNDLESSSIYRLELSFDDYQASLDSLAEVLRVGRDGARSGIHNVGDIDFDEDGNLWALFGEKDGASHAQNTSNLLGTLVRIVPDPMSGGTSVEYEPSPGNPFTMSGGRAEIFAYGLRSPWKGAFDGLGRYWIGDVGANAVEEINLVTEPGQNFGWPDAEGPCDDCSSVNPSLFWVHDDESGYLGDSPRSTRDGAGFVGLEYQPNSADPYRGRLDYRMIFGDYIGGFIRAAEISEAGEVLFDHHIGYLINATAWLQGPDGYLYGFRRRRIDIFEPGMDVVYRATLAEE